MFRCFTYAYSWKCISNNYFSIKSIKNKSKSCCQISKKRRFKGIFTLLWMIPKGHPHHYEVGSIFCHQTSRIIMHRHVGMLGELYLALVLSIPSSSGITVGSLKMHRSSVLGILRVAFLCHKKCWYLRTLHYIVNSLLRYNHFWCWVFVA